MAKFTITKKESQQFNNDLASLQEIIEDFKAGKELGVPNMDELIVRCEGCQEKIKMIKETYGKAQK